MRAIDSKVMGQSALARKLGALRRSGKRIVFTNGCFDVIHLGHVRYLSKARSLGDLLVVGLNSDASVRSIKGPSRPLNRQLDRALVLASLSFVDYVTVFGEDTPEKLIRRLKPDVLVKGADWKAADIVGADFVLSRGGRVARIPFVKGRSTTGLIRRMGRR